MTLSTSAVKRSEKGCLVAALFTLAFGAVYEIFSFGVFSFYMTYAFLFFMMGGCLFWHIVAGKRAEISAAAACFWNGGLTAITLGAVVHGILDIYGSYHPMNIVFWIIGGLSLLTGLIILVKST